MQQRSANKEVLINVLLNALDLVKDPHNVIVEVILEYIFDIFEGKV